MIHSRRTGTVIRPLPGVVALALASACVESPSPQRVPVGEWGGDHVALSVREDDATLEFDCAHGTVDERLTLDAEGRFDAKGRYVLEHGGPTRSDETESALGARYSGSVDGRDMDLAITLDDGRSVGPHRLALDRPARLFKCL